MGQYTVLTLVPCILPLYKCMEHAPFCTIGTQLRDLIKLGISSMAVDDLDGRRYHHLSKDAGKESGRRERSP